MIPEDRIDKMDSLGQSILDIAKTIHDQRVKKHLHDAFHEIRQAILEADKWNEDFRWNIARGVMHESA